MAFKMSGMDFGHGTGPKKMKHHNAPSNMNSTYDKSAYDMSPKNIMHENSLLGKHPNNINSAYDMGYGKHPKNMNHPLHMMGGPYNMNQSGQNGSPQKFIPALLGIAGRAALPYIGRAISGGLMRYATRNIPKAAGNLLMKNPTGKIATASRFIDKATKVITNPVKAMGFTNPILTGAGSLASWLTVPVLITKGVNMITGSGKDEEV